MDKRRRLNGVVGKVVVVCVKRGGDRVPSNFVTGAAQFGHQSASACATYRFQTTIIKVF